MISKPPLPPYTPGARERAEQLGADLWNEHFEGMYFRTHEKTCTDCKETKPLEEYRLNCGYRMNYCKVCERRKRREQYRRRNGR